MQNIWFIADTHYNHKNIVSSTTTWLDKSSCRTFNSLEEHDNTIVEGINKYVRRDDILYHVGDFSMGGRESVYDFWRRIICINIHIIFGNHDHHIRNNRPIAVDENIIYLASLFKSAQQILVKKIKGQNFVLCHHAMRTWDKAHYGAINLYGHSHGSLKEYTELKSGLLYKSTDVGVDVAFKDLGEYRPFHLDEILFKMKDRINLTADRKISYDD